MTRYLRIGLFRSMPHPLPQSDVILARRTLKAPSALYVLGFLIAMACLWAHLTSIDLFVRTQGIVRPEGDVIRISSEVGGRIRAVYRQEGETVDTGTPLVQLDPGERKVRRRNLQNQIVIRERQLASFERQLAALVAVHESEQDRIDTEVRSSQETLEQQEAQFGLRLRASAIRLGRTRTAHEAATILVDEGLVSEESWSTSLSELRLAELEYQQLTSDRPSASSVELLMKARDVETQKFQADRERLLAAVLPVHLELSVLRMQFDEVVTEEANTLIRSPSPGLLTLFENIHPGELLPQGSVIGMLEPSETPRVVEAVLANGIAARVEPGQKVRLIFNELQTIDGVVRSISPDVLRSESGAGAYRVIIDPGEQGLGLGLAMEVRFVTETETFLGLLVHRIKRSFGKIGG